MTGDAHAVPSQIVGEDEHDVRSAGARARHERRRRRGCRCRLQELPAIHSRHRGLLCASVGRRLSLPNTFPIERSSRVSCLVTFDRKSGYHPPACRSEFFPFK